MSEEMRVTARITDEEGEIPLPTICGNCWNDQCNVRAGEDCKCTCMGNRIELSVKEDAYWLLDLLAGQQQDRIPLIKAIRQYTGMSLKHSKILVERYIGDNPGAFEDQEMVYLPAKIRQFMKDVLRGKVVELEQAKQRAQERLSAANMAVRDITCDIRGIESFLEDIA